MVPELVTLEQAAARLLLPRQRVAEQIIAAGIPAAGVSDDGRRLLFSMHLIEQIGSATE